MIIKEEIIGDCRMLLGDCLEVMPLIGEFDAILTDPPYGIGADEAAAVAAKQRIAAKGRSKAGRGWNYYGESSWDRERPSKEIFDMMLKISKHQIIWGGNYFTDFLPPSMHWLIWDKGQRNFSLADFEMAWGSQTRAARIFQYARAKALKDGKRHPTQKPVELMAFCIGELPPKTQTILDPFTGSGTTGVACARLRRSFVGIEKSPEYFDIACQRIEEAYRQPDMFVAPPPPPTQESMF